MAGRGLTWVGIVRTLGRNKSFSASHVYMYNDETGLWQCPFCQQDNFPELSEVCATVLLWSLDVCDCVISVL